MLRAAANQASTLKWACIAGLLTSVFCTTTVHSRQSPAGPALETMVVAELPAQGRETYRLIHQGGPFPHGKDGIVFGNRERQLPTYKRGYYREYTVKTPGANNRGARRIVCGGPAITPYKCYYTADHYTSFREIVD